MLNKKSTSYQKILGHIRRASSDYCMLSPNDHIGVGVSGGKDSLMLLLSLWRLQKFLGIPYTLSAITVDPQFGGIPSNTHPIEQLCKELSIPYYVERTIIGELVFQVRKEENPCSLCAHMRRGALTSVAERLHCNKIALGHNLDDAVETFIMNLLWEGRLSCFCPFTDYSIPDEGSLHGPEKNLRHLSVIRPLIYAQEKEIRRAAADCGLPFFKMACPNDGKSGRQEAREWLMNQEKLYPGLKRRIFGAMVRGKISGWRNPK